MDALKLSFAVKDGRFSLCVVINGTAKRSYREVVGLETPNLSAWNVKKQIFEEPTIVSIRNNKVLKEVMKHYASLVKTYNPQTPQELFELDIEPHPAMIPKVIKRKPRTKKPMTFGEYVLKLIDEMRNSPLKRPSKNYQTNINLYHKLEKEGNIINVPLAQIDNKHFIAFGDWILTLTRKEGKYNYRRIMALFKSVHSKAYELELNNNTLRFKFNNKAPVQDKEKRISLTKEEYDKFVNLDLKQIFLSGVKREFYKELYHDFCIFLYEMKMRPVDVIQLTTKNIINYKGRRCITYIPEKKKNYIERAIVINGITPMAQSIIDKYQGQSTQGYIFPFSMNNYDWSAKSTDALCWNRWQNKKQAALERINLFLKKVAVVIGVEPKKLVIYTFRHTAFTHAVRKGDKPLLDIAKEGGTGVDMIEDFYYDYLAV